MAIDPAPWNEANLHSFNRYAFANNNPLRFVDPDGREAEELPQRFGNKYLRPDPVAFQKSVDEMGDKMAASAKSAASEAGQFVLLAAVTEGLAPLVRLARALGASRTATAAVGGADAAKATAEVASAANYRALFLRARPDLPSGWAVHHGFPQRYDELMRAAGVNIHEVQFLRGVSPQLHSKITTEWERFHRAAGGNPSAAQVADLAKHIDKRYGDSFVWPGF
jgi:hypothetical protein